MKTTLFYAIVLILFNTGLLAQNYKGHAWHDSVQTIPGKIQCELFDEGGQGVAYNDSDAVNNGSGNLNPNDGSFYNTFRINEGVDISYTKFRDPAIDNNPYNLVNPEKNQLYVGWTKPGEWTKYTVEVKEEGTYQLGLMYTANKDGKISFSINDVDVSGPILITSTFVAADTVAWRQWHHWNYLNNITSIHLKKGLQTLTINTSEVGDMNYDYVKFERVK